MKPYPNAEEENLDPEQDLGAIKKGAKDDSIIYDIPEIQLVYKKDASIPMMGKVTSSAKGSEFIRIVMGLENIPIQEQFIALFLNRSNKVIGYYKQSKGGISGTVVDVRLLFAVGAKCLASGMVVAHNHPSGGLIPSEQDNIITKKIKLAGKLLEITVLDHLIITLDGYYSYADEMLMGTDSPDPSYPNLDGVEKDEYSINKKAQALIEKAKHLKF